jgi:lipoyl(octanoyl) transferase
VDEPLLRMRGRVEWPVTAAQMLEFTAARGPSVRDEIWLCEHEPVYTQGVSGKAAHVLDARGIPVVQANRGGQVTYHGPGQVVAYPLIDLQRLGIYVKEYVFRLEQALIKTLAAFDVTGHRVLGAPGIYVRLDDPGAHALLAPPQPGQDPFVGLAKIAALGIKVSRHCAYHGVALNVAMDLRPFEGINPCGYASLRTVDLSTIGVQASWQEVADLLGRKLAAYLSP